MNNIWIGFIVLALFSFVIGCVSLYALAKVGELEFKLRGFLNEKET